MDEQEYQENDVKTNNNCSLTMQDNAYTNMWHLRGSGWAGSVESLSDEFLPETIAAKGLAIRSIAHELLRHKC